MTLEVALKAMLADADKWQTMSEQLSTMEGSVTSLRTWEQSFTFAGGEVSAAYDEFCETVRALVAGGSQKIATASDTLEHVHAVFSGTDQNAKDELLAKWQWL